MLACERHHASDPHHCGDSESYKSVDWSGSTIDLFGAVHSDSGINVGGSTNSVTGDTTYECSGQFNGGGGNSFIPEPRHMRRRPPVNHVYEDFNDPGVCTFYGPSDDAWDLSNDGDWWGPTRKKESKQLEPGVYCTSASGDKAVISLSDQGISGNVTFVAGYSIEISGSDFDLTPFKDGVLMFSDGDNDVALKLSASGGDWGGLLYAPNGTAVVSGSDDWALSGGIVAETVTLAGSEFSITGTIGEPGPESRELAITE